MKSTPVQQNLQLAENFALLEELSDEASSQVSGGVVFGGGDHYRQRYRNNQFTGRIGRGSHPNTARW